jgi:hypothetical protein
MRILIRRQDCSAVKLDDSQSVYSKYYYDWKDGSPDSQGIKIGLTHSF